MKSCWNCRSVNADEAGYCSACGADISAGALSEEQRFLDDCRVSLNHERLALRIVGIVFTVISVFFVLCVLMTALFSEPISFIYSAADEAADIAVPFFIFVLLYALVYAAVFFAIGTVNLVSASRTEKMLDTVYTDLSAVVKRNGSAKRIVFGAFFNSIAMIFIIINFSRLKSRQALVARITAKQNASRRA